MKKILVFVLCFVLFVSSAKAAVTVDDTFISVNDFNTNFNVACILTGSGHKITSTNLQFTIGDLRDCFIITLGNGIIELHVYMPHIKDYNGKTNDINEIDLWFYSDGTVESVEHLTSAIIELALTTGAIDRTKDANNFITKLGFLDNVSDGAENTLTINGLNYSYMISSMFGFHFSITKAK